MPLPVYETADAVPQEQREDYAEHDGKWRHKVEIEVATEKKKRAVLLSEKREADRLRVEAEEKVAIAERAAEARARGISEEALEEIREKEKAARKPIEDELVSVKAENRKLKLTDRVKALALHHGVMPDRIGQAMKILDGRTDLGDRDGIVVKEEDGTVSAETIDDFLATTFRKESPWFYASTNASGSGASGSSSSGDLPPADKQKATEAKREIVANAF